MNLNSRRKVARARRVGLLCPSLFSLVASACSPSNPATGEGAIDDDGLDLTQAGDLDETRESLTPADEGGHELNSSEGDESEDNETDSGADSETSSQSETDDGSDDDDWTPKFDIAVDDEGDVDPGDEDFSYIWIANTSQGTLSKIDTRTAHEVARYRTGPAGSDLQPSRTSVSLTGDAVVANRGSGSVVKFAARPVDCVDRNGDGSIQTSTGPHEILDWQSDECMLWAAQPGFLGGGGGSRGLAWDFHEDAAGQPAPRVWVGFRNDPSDGHIVRLNGDTGAIEADVVLPGWSEVFGQGVYGAAIGPGGDLWAIGKGGSVLHVDAVTLQERRWRFDPPAGWNETFYGMTVDGEGGLWVGGQSGQLYRFDTLTETMEVLDSVAPQKLYGIAIDKQGIAWIAAQQPCALLRYDVDARIFLGAVALPGCSTPVGTSVDFDGYAWVVDKDAHRAYKVDPVSLDLVIVEGLVTPYTYSDMTGGALEGVIPPGLRRRGR